MRIGRDAQSTVLVKLYGAVAAVFIALGLVAALSRGGWFAMTVTLLVLLVSAEITRVLSSRTVIVTFLTLVLWHYRMVHSADRDALSRKSGAMGVRSRRCTDQSRQGLSADIRFEGHGEYDS